MDARQGTTSPTGRSEEHATIRLRWTSLCNTAAWDILQGSHCSSLSAEPAPQPLVHGRRTRSTNTGHVDHPRMAPSASQLRKAEFPAATAREAMHAHMRVINCFTLTDDLSRTRYVSHCIPSNAKLKYLADKGGFARPDLLPPRPPNDAVGVGRPLSWCEEPVSLRSGTSCH